MSNRILRMDSVPGQFSRIRRVPMHRTVVQEVDSGKEARVGKWTTPRYRYELEYEFLRTAAAFSEWQAISSHFRAHAGRLYSFLWEDPDDKAVTDHGFGVGNGTTTAFQLQRTLGGAWRDVLGEWETYDKPRTNELPRSQEFENAAWTKTGGGTGAAPVVTANAGVAPDGSLTADRVVFDKGAGTAATDMSHISSATNTPTGATYTGSIWLRTADGSTSIVRIRLGSATATITVTPAWQRFSVQRTSLSEADSTAFGVWLRGTWGTADRADLFLWGAQREPGLVAPSRYIPTAAAAVRADPAYWPAIGDGFEPVTEPDWATVSIFADSDGLGRRTLSPASRTNLALQSQTLDSATWGKTNVTVTADAVAAPDGTTTADKVVETAVTGQHTATQPLALGLGTHTLSVYVKAAERTRGELQIFSVADNSIARFDLGTGSIVSTGAGGTATGVSATCTAVGNGWFRVTLTHTIGTAGTLTVYLALHDAAGTQSYLGVAGSGLYYWGAQLETGSAAGDYIPTSTAAVARTDYTFTAAGVVTFAAAPAAGAALSWTGSYYRRVRLDDDEPELDRFLPGYYRGTIELVSVI